MLHDPIEDLTLPARARPSSPRYMLAAGVAGAVALGVGAGLWARPVESERRLAPVQAEAPAPLPRSARQIEIVLDDTPAPIGAPIEVLPAMDGEANGFTPPPVEAMPMAPVRPPAGLVRVQAVEPVEPVAAEPEAPRGPSAAELRAEQRKAQARKAELKAERAEKAAAKAKLEKARLEKARLEKTKLEKTKLEKAKLEKARLAKAKAKVEPKTADRKLARTDAPKSKAAKAKSKAELAKAEKTRKAMAAKAEAAEKAEAKRAFAKLGKALGKVVPHRAKAAEAKLAARTDPKPKAKVARPKVEKAVAQRAAKPERPPKVDRDAGPLRKVSNKGGCASSDPGAAMVCADPSLGAADRQMTRAYREAEAAGVPAWRLQQQHQRWLAARSAAAREAPWAVQDVYSARIAELRDLARDAGSY